MATPSQPDICVSIDFGATFTGVAWMRPVSGEIKIISDWPGRTGEHKVPTVLAKDWTGDNIQWGFQCSELDENEKWRLFKLCLNMDPNELQQMDWAPNDLNTVREIMTRYLRQLYLYISKKIEQQIRQATPSSNSWANLAVSFIFSVPATWNPCTVQEFYEIVRRAGFCEAEGHDIVPGLTEAEATLIPAIEYGIRLDDRDILLSIDAGGATTDLAVVKLESAKLVTMKCMQSISGMGIGSGMIDMHFKRLVDGRLSTYSQSQQLPKNCAQEILQSQRYQTWKHQFGSEYYGTESGTYIFPVLGVSSEFIHPGIRVKDGGMLFEKQELDGLFERQFEEIKESINNILDMFENGRRKIIKYAVLSGGLGGSEYILKRLKVYFESQDSTRTCVKGMRLLRSEDPQLAVIRGLLLDWKNGILRSRIARASYGLVVESLYSNKSNFDQVIIRDPYNRKKYVNDQIEWVIKKGDEIANKTVSHTFKKRLALGDAVNWDEQIVWSENPEQSLPRNMTDPGVEKLRTIPIRLTNGAMQKQKRGWTTRHSYLTCEYTVDFVVEPSGRCRIDVRSEDSFSKAVATIDVEMEQVPRNH
ncbi:hypothetical protein F5884DRAFT_899792 [Xylogone sp. PMI_703]|nr:hypothetical protein F5884DRAFT_899792 [Xylogone sp. PMI_703]